VSDVLLAPHAATLPAQVLPLDQVLLNTKEGRKGETRMLVGRPGGWHPENFQEELNGIHFFRQQGVSAVKNDRYLHTFPLFGVGCAACSNISQGGRAAAGSAAGRRQQAAGGLAVA